MSHECRLQFLLECHIFGIIQAGSGQKDGVASFFSRGSRAGASSENVSRPTTGLHEGQQSGVSVGTKLAFMFLNDPLSMIFVSPMQSAVAPRQSTDRWFSCLHYWSPTGS